MFIFTSVAPLRLISTWLWDQSAAIDVIRKNRQKLKLVPCLVLLEVSSVVPPLLLFVLGSSVVR